MEKRLMLKLNDMAEKFGWFGVDWQPANRMVSFSKEEKEFIRINIWQGKKGRTVGIQSEKNGYVHGYIKSKYLYNVTDQTLEKVFSNYLLFI